MKTTNEKNIFIILGTMILIFGFFVSMSMAGAVEESTDPYQCTLDIYVWDQSHNPLSANVYVDSAHKGYTAHVIVPYICTFYPHSVFGERQGYQPDEKIVTCSPGETKRVDLTLIQFKITTTTTTTVPTTTVLTTTSTICTTTTIPCTTTTTIPCTTTTTIPCTTTTTTTTTLPVTITTPIGPRYKSSMFIEVNRTCFNQVATVNVVTSRGGPVRDVELDIYFNGKKVAYGYTDGRGIFKFTPEKVGDYHITATKTDYYDAGLTVRIPDCIELCYDGIRNQNETDIDCGNGCAPCDDDRKCKIDGDCKSRYCYKGVCRKPSCYDGILNQGEEKIKQIMSSDLNDTSDCGGLNCPPCPTCDDEIQNQGEEDIDCGGPCKPCITICPTCPNCFDNIKNIGETDVDCGGPCSPCDDGKICRLDEDCQSGYCYNKTCRTPTCSDGIKNQNETDIDCGGVCSPCPTPRLGIIGSVIKFISERTGSLLVALFFIFLGLSYFAYKKGKERGRMERENEKEIEAVLDERIEEKKEVTTATTETKKTTAE